MYIKYVHLYRTSSTDRDLFENTTFPNSNMVKNRRALRAVGMLEAGLTQAQVSKYDVGVNLRIQ